MQHKWFRGVDFELVERRGIMPPWVPQLKDCGDTAWFESYPESDEPADAIDYDQRHLFDDF